MSTEARPDFEWVEKSRVVLECNYWSVKLHVEKSAGKWSFWVRHPSKGLIQDGEFYVALIDALNAAEDAALDSLGRTVKG